MTHLLLLLALVIQLSPFEAETLPGRKVTFPDVARGKVTLLIAGFTKDSQKQTEAWAKRVHAEFPSLETWSLADLEELPRLLRPLVVRGIRSSLPQQQQDHFAIVYKGSKVLRQAAGYTGGDDAWLILLNEAGASIWQTHGAVEKEMAALRGLMKK